MQCVPTGARVCRTFTMPSRSRHAFISLREAAFRLGDRLNADVRFDANNVLNNVVYQSWITSINSAQFGLPTSANAMRSLVATMRVRF